MFEDFLQSCSEDSQRHLEHFPGPVPRCFLPKPPLSTEFSFENGRIMGSILAFT